MRYWIVGLTVFLTLFGCATSAKAQRSQTRRIVAVTQASGGSTSPSVVTATSWLGGATDKPQVLVGSDGQVYIGLWIDVPNARTVPTQRPPVDIALVIDTSGSMSGEKIEHARMAATSLLESLRDGDIVSVYTFSTAVTQIAPPTVIHPTTRADLIQRVSVIQPMGSTNLFDGLRAGEASMAQAPPSHPVRRVVVISDGMANVGPSTPEELGQVAAQGTEYGAQVTAIGVGLEYDERTLAALAVRSSGRLYHLERPAQMASILREELELLGHTVATEAFIEVTPAAGVEILGAETVQGEMTEGRLRVPLGSLYGGQHREVLVRARVNTATPGPHTLATARLVFREPTGARAERSHPLSLQYTVTSDPVAASRSVDRRVETMVASVRAARAQLQAVAMLNQGRVADAARVLASAEEQLNRVAASAPAALRDRVRRQIEGLRRGRASASRAALPHASPAAARAAALGNNDDAFEALGY